MCAAINRITKVDATIMDYQLHSVTAGDEAQGECSVKVLIGGKEFNGRGVSTDVIEASAKAYLNAICRSISRATHRADIVRPGQAAPQPLK
jgi:2-isopropylmalate synthase